MGERQREAEAEAGGSGMKQTPVAEAWSAFEKMVLPANASRDQRVWMKRAFYGGAGSLLAFIMNGVSPGPDCQPGDEDFITAIHQEIIDYGLGVINGTD